MVFHDIWRTLGRVDYNKGTVIYLKKDLLHNL